MNNNKELKIAFWNAKLQEYFEENKLVLLFLEDDIQLMLKQMHINEVLLISGGTEYIIKCHLQNPFETIAIEHLFAMHKYECNIKRNYKSILSENDKDIIRKLFSDFKWFDMHADINLNKVV